MSEVKDKKSKAAPVPDKVLSIKEQADAMNAIERSSYLSYLEKLKTKPRPPKIKVGTENGKTKITVPIEGHVVNAVALGNAFGTTSDEFVSHSMSELVDAACRGSHTTSFNEIEINSVLTAMAGINPHDEIEGMLASQMVATHFAAMRQLRNTKNSERINQQDSNGNLAIKLMRTFTTQLEALQKYRGKGQQKVTVEHVTVNAGGQAIVGNVNHPGGGDKPKTEEQPHAKEIEHAQLQEMPSQNPNREEVPVTSNA